MKFKAGDPVWALSGPTNEVGIPPGSYPGIIVDYMETIDGPQGPHEYYHVDVDGMPGEDGRGFVICHLLLRHRDRWDDPIGDSDENPNKIVNWDNIPTWDRDKIKVTV
jgi:hypothetical protein